MTDIPAEQARLDMTGVIELLEESLRLARKLDGQPTNIERSKNTRVMARNSENSKTLLYAVHVIDSARVGMNSQYHLFRGQNPPIIEMPDDA